MRGSERFTQRASTAITKAHDAAMGMGHSYVGTEHLLLGIIREGEGLGARILTDNALTDAVLTRMVTETVGRGVPGAPEQGLSPRARHVIELAAEDANRSVTATSARSTSSWASSARRTVPALRHHRGGWRRPEQDLHGHHGRVRPAGV